MERIDRLHGVAIKAANELCVGDVILDRGFLFERSDGEVAVISKPELVAVNELDLVNDDVLINGGAWTTSVGNKFLVITDNGGNLIKSWKLSTSAMATD